MRHIYGGRIGAEFAHVSTGEERLWLQDRFQEGRLHYRFDREERLNLLWQLSAAEGLERYLHTRYVGQKRFSLEGAEALIPLLDDVVQRCGATGVEEIVIGMAHRGRLNVLVNVLGKAPSMLFSEFEGHVDLDDLKGSGDVKYHKGFSADLRTTGGNVHVVLAFNPSHLEVVNPVVEGSVRARQERRGDTTGSTVVPLLIHGDAAFAGQGVVMETLQLSQARGFRTGGTLHVVINNQVGFTTSEPSDARSTLYCSDVAKMIEAPILHVNADDPEAVVFVTRLALEYRMKFRKDVVIDLVCYRRHGHNEADEPSATQPMMYQAIRKHPTARQIYGERLEQDGMLDEGQAAQMIEDYRRGLDEGRPQARAFAGTTGNRFTVDWSRHLAGDWSEQPATGVERGRLATLAATLTQVPAGFTLHPRVARIVDDRRRMYADELPLDWGAAETLAYATLLADGVDVRLTGQDSARGTFFHRHAVWHDQATGRTHVPLATIAEGHARFRVIDSTLSEEAVLGFEYGFSTTDPETLVIWEGQFGDFVNGAQVIVDQFITSGEAKWGTGFRPDAVPAARLRGAGTGAQLGAPRALPAALGRDESPGLRAVDSRADVPPAAPADAAGAAQAAHRDDAEEPAAPQALVLDDGGSRDRPVPHRHRRPGTDRARASQPRRALQRQGVLRPAGAPAGRRRQGHRAGAHRAAVSVSRGGVPGDPRALCQCPRDRLVPGGAAEPGRLVPDPPPAAGRAHARARAPVCRPRERRGAGHGHPCPAPAGAGCRGRGGALLDVDGRVA